jgi:hypothetical protein
MADMTSLFDIYSLGLYFLERVYFSMGRLSIYWGNETCVVRTYLSLSLLVYCPPT